MYDEAGLGRSHALVIGVDRPAESAALSVAAQDAEKVYDLLVETARFDHVVLLTDAAAAKGRVTKLMEETFPAIVGPDDRFLFFFVGRSRVEIGDGNRNHPTLLLAENPEDGALTLTRLRHWDTLLWRARQALFVIDAGLTLPPATVAQATLQGTSQNPLADYGHHLLTGEMAGTRFTSVFLRAVAGSADANGDGIVELGEILAFAESDLVPTTTSSVPALHLSLLRQSAGELFFVLPESPTPTMATSAAFAPVENLPLDQLVREIAEMEAAQRELDAAIREQREQLSEVWREGALNPESPAAKHLDAAMQVIQEKEKRIDIVLKHLQSQKEAIIQEIQGLEKVMTKNVATFGIMEKGL